MRQGFATIVITLLLLSNSLDGIATPRLIPAYHMSDYDHAIAQLYRDPRMHARAIQTRLQVASEYFRGKPYLLDALGEGQNAPFDQDPLYRTDAFDCMTFVSTVLALANADQLSQFQQVIRQINYEDGQVNYFKRNHFTFVDWNQHNSQQGKLRSITADFVDAQGRAVATQVTRVTDKKNWYRKKTSATLTTLQPMSAEAVQQSLLALKQGANSVATEPVRLEFIPLNVLFNEQGEPTIFLFKQIPNGSIIELVTPDWDRTRDLGTFIDTAHMGFAFQTAQGLLFRDASPWRGSVGDQALIPYLRQFLHSRTVKGIHVLVAVDRS